VADLPFQLEAPLAQRLRAAADLEGKIPRALEALGPLAGRRVGFIDVPDGPLLDVLRGAASEALSIPAAGPFRIDRPDGSLDAVLSLWSAFRGVDPRDLAEVDRVLAPDGRLLIVHDYGRDDVCGLGEPDAPEYGVWSRREGPFLRGGGFKIRVLHCFWTFSTIDEAQAFLSEAFGERGATVAATMRRPRLAWNVAIYHRWRGGIAPATADELDPATA
jgi:SAM-dependent methyltransferase